MQKREGGGEMTSDPSITEGVGIGLYSASEPATYSPETQ